MWVKVSLAGPFCILPITLLRLDYNVLSICAKPYVFYSIKSFNLAMKPKNSICVTKGSNCGGSAVS